MLKGYFSYIRVSTVRQGQIGTSLTEKKEAIQRYADRWNLRIVKEFEEKETAARSGRPVFRTMLRELKRQHANGLIIHKIDRSARNLRDWAELGELIDEGIEIHFANENLDLESRGGRLSADIQAVVAADYIRNLREEVKKGFYGRLKQGFYPMPAPIGYMDRGAAQPKEPDPSKASLIIKAFQIYARGDISIRRLTLTMYDAGLRTRGGNRVSENGMATILHNTFYTGVIKIGPSGEMFVGRHQPIISKTLFDQVQRALSGRHIKGIRRHDFLFRRLLVCADCRRTLIGEIQKAKIYYRCQTRTCEQKTIREDEVNVAVVELLRRIRFSDDENRYLTQLINARTDDFLQMQESLRQTLTIQLEQSKSRLAALTDAYLDGLLDKDSYIAKKNQLVADRQATTEKLDRLKQGDSSLRDELKQKLELANTAYISYETGSVEEKRQMVARRGVYL
jgi:DNA invertase Pin-like site-specific DNA recombinase